MQVRTVKKALGLLYLTVMALPQSLWAITWLELSTRMMADNNAYSYVLPFADFYSLSDFRFSHRDKMSRATHYAVNYTLNGAAYNRLTNKNYWNHQLGLNLEEDVAKEMALAFNLNGTVYNYTDLSSAKYNYRLWTAAASWRWFFFAWQFTNLDAGVQYSLYTLPNYDFSKEGWAPSLVFQEEVAEYSGFGAFATVKQAIPWSLDLELQAKINSQYCGERPLYTAVNVFSGDNRRDLETTLSLTLGRAWAKSSSCKLIVCSTQIRSNANAQVYGVEDGVHIESGYYNRGKLRIVSDNMLTYGQDSGFVRIYFTYTLTDYSSRNAQNITGNRLGLRSDREYSALAEFNQRLGYWLGASWTLKLGYQYTQNLTNEYYYQFSREMIYLGASTALYL